MITEIVIYLALILSGFIAGFLSGLLGIGGGLIFVPVLLTVGKLGIISPLQSVVVVIATSVFTAAITTSSSFYNHRKISNIDYKLARTIILGSASAAIIIPVLLKSADTEILVKVLGITLGVVGIQMFFGNGNQNKIKKLKPIFLTLLGFLFGALAVVSGLGGGLFFTPILFYFTDLDFKKSVGTSTIIVLTTMIFAAIPFLFIPSPYDDFLQVGCVNFEGSLALIVGAVIGPKYGIQFLNYSSNNLIKRIFSLFLLFYSIKLLLYG